MIYGNFDFQENHAENPGNLRYSLETVIPQFMEHRTQSFFSSDRGHFGSFDMSIILWTNTTNT